MALSFRFNRIGKIALRLGTALGAALLGACATYKPLPLNNHPASPQGLGDIEVDTRSLPFPALRAYHFNPADGLDMTEVAILAVVNNPDLKLVRDDLGVSRAQAFAAHLLPDPQISLSRDYPQGGQPGTTTATSVGLGYDLNALITHAAGADAADAEARKTDLNLLWQEWQVIAKARVLFSQVMSEGSQLHWLTQNRDLLARQYRQSAQALKDGNVTADTANAALIAWHDARRQVNDMQRQLLASRQNLNDLLGLAPSAQLQLVAGAPLALPDAAEAEAALRNLAERRPDLLALKAGYQAQDARYRQAILAQFPPLNLSLNRSSDTSAIVTRGFAIASILPLLDGNRGNIRIEKATRKRLHDDYEQRLTAARNGVEHLLANNRLLAQQLESAQAALPELDSVAANAHKALQAGSLDWAGYVGYASAAISAHVEVENLKQTLLEGRIQLLTLLGGEFPAVKPDVEKKS